MADERVDIKISSTADVGGFEKTASHTRGLKQGLRGLALEFPMLARVAGIALNPIGLTLGALTLLFGKAFGALKKLGDGIGGTTPASEALALSIKKQSDALFEAALSAEEFERALAAVGSSQDDTRARTEAAITAIKNQTRARLEQADAERELALARLGVEEGAGRISPELAAAARLGIEQNFANLRKRLRDQESAETIKVREDEARQLVENIQQLEQDLAQKRIALAEAGSAEEAKIRLTNAQEALARLTAVVAKGYDKIGEFTDEQMRIMRMGVVSLGKEVDRQSAATLATLNQIKAAQEAVTGTQAQLLGARARQVTVGRELPAARSEAEQEGASRAKVFGLETQRRALDLPSAPASPFAGTRDTGSEFSGTRDAAAPVAAAAAQAASAVQQLGQVSVQGFQTIRSAAEKTAEELRKEIANSRGTK